MSDDRKTVRIGNILDDSEYSFWSEVRKHFPLSKGGDFPPSAKRNWESAIEDAVITWWDFNASDHYDLILMNGTILSSEANR